MESLTLPIIMRMYEVYKNTTSITMKLPKRWYYTIGVSLEKSVLDCLGELIMAKNAPKALKAAYLIKAGSHLELTTLKLRFLLEEKLANETKIFQTQAAIGEVGRMLGGWRKSLQST